MDYVVGRQCKMTKLLTIPLSIAIILNISGCNITGVANAFIDNHNEREELKQQAETIVECFNTGDIDTLEAMFCEKVRTHNDLSLEIQNAYDCLDSKIVSYEYLNFGLIGSIEEGKYYEKEYGILLTITTDKNKHYSINFTRFFVNDSKPELYQLRIWIETQKNINGEIMQDKKLLYDIR